MGIIDRYVLRVFARILVVCFLSLVGLYLVIDVFNNLEEFLRYSKVKGGLANVLVQFYAPRILTFFDLISPLLTVISGVFTITWLQRSRELTAIMAGGIPPSRAITPLLFGAILVMTLSALNRELLIPRYQDSLSRNAQNWLGQAERPVHPCYDKQWGINLSGRAVVAKEEKIVGPVFRLSTSTAAMGHKLEANVATYSRAVDDRPAGYWLKEVKKPIDIDERLSVFVDGQPVILTSADTPWLSSGECFLASRVPFSRLTGEELASRFAATGELISVLRNPSLGSGANIRVAVHSRFVQPFLDGSLFLMGIALVLSRRQRNVFVAAGLCMFVVNGFYLVNLVFQALGNNLILSPAIAAWSPLFLFGPMALYMATPIWD
jgi:lipopolysaccharide export system permease protein